MANEGDAERLVVLLEARIRDFERNMAKASGTAGKNFGQMRRDSKTATEKMEADMVRSSNRINEALAATSAKIGMLGKSMIAGFAGGLIAGGVAGLVSQIGQVASAVASVGDEARRAGVGVEAFQELKYVAEQNRIGVDALTDGIKELNLRADEFIVTGGGSAAEAFQRLGYSVEDLSQKLKDPSALFTEIIGKLGQLDKAAQIRIADEIFGGAGGEQFVQLIAQGEQGIKDTIDQARSLGVVMSEDLIEKAVDLDRKFNAVSTTVGNALKVAIVEASNALGVFLDQFRSIEERTFIRPLQNQLSGVYEQRFGVGQNISNLEAEIANMGDWNPLKMLREGELEQLKVDFADLTTEADQLLSRITELQGRGTTPPPIIPPKPTVPGSGAPPTRDKEAEALERQQTAIKNLIAGLEFEKSLIGLSALEQQKLTALRQAGAAATEGQKLRIAELVEQTNAEQAQVDYLSGLYDMLGQAGMGAINGITDALSDGKIEADEFGDILGSVLGMAGQFFLNQGFKGFGSIFGFSGGGYTGAGGVNEPAGVVHKGEVVWSQRDIARAGGVGIVEAMRQGFRGYAGGGLVEPYSAPPAASTSEVFSPQYSITNNITLTGTATEEDGAAYARGFTRMLAAHFPAAMEAYKRNPHRRTPIS